MRFAGTKLQVGMGLREEAVGTQQPVDKGLIVFELA